MKRTEQSHKRDSPILRDLRLSHSLLITLFEFKYHPPFFARECGIRKLHTVQEQVKVGAACDEADPFVREAHLKLGEYGRGSCTTSSHSYSYTRPLSLQDISCPSGSISGILLTLSIIRTVGIAGYRPCSSIIAPIILDHNEYGYDRAATKLTV